MHFRAALLLAILLTSCDTKDSSSDDWDEWSDDTAASSSNGTGPGGGTGACDVEGTALGYPTADGATDFYYRAAVEFVFDGIDEDATVTLTDASGAAVDGSTSWVDSSLVFQPVEPLSASANYTAAMNHCAGSSSVQFRTGSLGTPIGSSVDLVGNTYVVGLDGARFVKPVGVGSLLLGLLEQDILLGVTAVSDTEIEMIGAISRDDSTTQDRCEPSIDFNEAADFSSSPFFSIGPQNARLSAAGTDIAINQLNISGDFTADGSQIGGAILSGEIDARDIVGALVGGGLLEDEDPDAVCTLFSTFGVTCEACSSDGAPYCLSIYVDQITANSDDQTLVAQNECDPEACTEGCD